MNNIHLIWYQRHDGAWNADCLCGAGLAGVEDDDRADAEAAHVARVESEREHSLLRPGCGPKFPNDNHYIPAPLIFR